MIIKQRIPSHPYAFIEFEIDTNKEKGEIPKMMEAAINQHFQLIKRSNQYLNQK